ncbi:hypothetical protein K2173_023844 [Erythroxylum novogranatense]|uniref:Thioredoxin domain-containing protein n=1 Tax=Erythroxylum novogranatense TaxID=1862640 RepID=A0AAV8S5J1_9ROSI|nr:hypothetical protein K2173_023844 [Erythroxylum novogranatense]
MGGRIGVGLLLLLILILICGWLPYSYSSAASPAQSARVSMCRLQSLSDSIFGIRDQNDDGGYLHVTGVTEGDEGSLLKALDVLHKNNHTFVAVLFYASWCPFSRNFRPIFSLLSSLYPSIHHLAIEESSVRPMTLHNYKVHGFPRLFLLNSTMRVRYHGSRGLDSLVLFYTDVTGIQTASLDKGVLDKIARPPNYENHDQIEQENCPFPWARSPDKWFAQETCLALATAFVILRSLYLFLPALHVLARVLWRRRIRIIRLGSLLDHAGALSNQVVQLCISFKEPCGKRNLQEGAINARAWASKSLVTVSIGDSNSSRGPPVSE